MLFRSMIHPGPWYRSLDAYFALDFAYVAAGSLCLPWFLLAMWARGRLAPSGEPGGDSTARTSAGASLPQAGT